MPFIEAPTTFYLGRRYDHQTHRLDDEVIYYDSRDLTTHAVVVGMTGSGKTGLCITLLEEAILDNIPSIVIDPKGDITNLILNFPDLRPQDFEPWVNIDDARRAGLDVPAYAADVAQRWKDGLTSWGIVPDRLRWLQRAAKYSIYTPGSDAGLPISILASLRAPKEGWDGNEESNREKINGIVTALLALIGMNVEPVKDREHVFVANIFEHNWRLGRDLTLEDIILQVQQPPFEKLGVFPVDDYIPEKARRKLAMELNSIVAAPSFQSWIQGAPMDIQSLLYQPNGRPNVSIFYIAHLNEAERMFITTLLLENMLGWMRGLSGTTSLRALLYIDEMFGYFPPYPKNPPTKGPLMRLLKQARAFGIGLIMATQNPGDLDYKGLSNTGTWFIGRLQSENDRKKVMAGLESMADASTEDDLELKDVAKLIADIDPRVFLMRNVHDQGGPVMLHTRWAMSYLRGPLTRQQVQFLMRNQREQLNSQLASQQAGNGRGGAVVSAQASAAGVPPSTLPETGVSQSAAPPSTLPETQPAPQQQYTQPQQTQQQSTQYPQGWSGNPMPLPSAISQFWIATTISAQQALAQTQQPGAMLLQQSAPYTLLAYYPVLLAQASIRYQNRKAGIYTTRSFAYHIPDVQKTGLTNWDEYPAPIIDRGYIIAEPQQPAMFADLPPGLTDARRIKALQTEFMDMLYNTAVLTIPFNPQLKIYGSPDSPPGEFESQVQQAAREQRDAEIDKTTKKYEDMIDKLEDRYQRILRELEAEKAELSDRKREQLYTTGEAVLSLLKGRTTYTLSRMSRTRRYSQQSEQDIRQHRAELEDLEARMDDIEAEYSEVVQGINDKWAAIAAKNEEEIITPYKKDIHIEMFGVG
ncbi:MAG: DUF87 domain-containing protein, partial [Chloroflexi bacterium]